MPLTINTNLSSLIVQSSLKQSTFGLNQAIERMTTGFKINGAKDNAANYSISTQMSTKLSAYQVAEDNASMGLDLLTTAGDSLSLINEHLTRIRDLTTQAKNGTYGDESMKAINAEVNARLDEIERLYSTTEFNGLKIFETTGVKGTPDTPDIPETPDVPDVPDVPDTPEVPNPPSKVSAAGFLEKVTRRDTTSMTSLSTIDENTLISSGTYSIATAEELAKLSVMANKGKVSGGEFVLANDIDLSAYSTGEGWTPIDGSNLSFDGNGYVVSNLFIDRPSADNQGLFSWVKEIKNLGIENANVTGKNYVGALVAHCAADNTEINNCFASGKVTGVNCVGGLIGASEAEVANINNVCADVETSGKVDVGGLIGTIMTGGWGVVYIKNSFSAGNVTGNTQVGSFAGSGGAVQYAGAYFQYCYATGNVSGDDYVGGFIGKSSSSIYNSYCTGTVTSSGTNVGDFAGYDSYSQYSGFLSPDDPKPFEYFPIKTNSSRVAAKAAAFSPDNIGDVSSTSTMNSIYFQVGISSSSDSQIGFNISFSLPDINTLRNIGLVDGNYLETIDNILASISAKQTEYGACQNRLESALEEINTHYENLLSSRSTLRDADVAQESSAYIRNQILQQASATLLATANQTPAIALQLL